MRSTYFKYAAQLNLCAFFLTRIAYFKYPSENWTIYFLVFPLFISNVHEISHS